MDLFDLGINDFGLVWLGKLVQKCNISLSSIFFVYDQLTNKKHMYSLLVIKIYNVREIQQNF